MEKNVKKKRYVSLSGLSVSTDSDENACIVCFRTVDIYSIGECDHPVCHECSTRMRVLCRRTECPICRKDMAMVIFTSSVKNFSQFQYRNMNCERRFLIYFDTDFVMNAFDELLEHRCNLCPDNNINHKSFAELKDHKKKIHDEYYCDLCIDNLKIFSKERRSYTRQNLAQHRRKGDIDDKSHRGHPICEFCESRFMDNDDLFRHLRRDHYFCHFCDADGLHQYYDDYNSLRKHFFGGHFLCEEGSCVDERFTSVFRNKLDYQAHYTQNHAHMMNKAQARQARTVDISFTVNHKQGQFFDRGGRGGRRNNDNEEQAVAASALPPSMTMVHPSQTIDINCAQDFPTLGKIAPVIDGEASVTRSIAHKLAQQNRFSISTIKGSALNEEEFPRLGSSTGTTNSPSTSVHLSVSNRMSSSKGPNISVQYNCTEMPATNKRIEKVSGSITLNSHTGAKPKNSLLEDDFPLLQSKVSPIENLAATWTTSSQSRVIKAPRKTPAPPKREPVPTKGKIFESKDFPTLAPSSGSHQMFDFSNHSSVTIPVKKINNTKSKENEENLNSKNKKKKIVPEKANNKFEANKNKQNVPRTKKKPLTLNNIFDDIDPDAPIEDFSKGKLGEYESMAPSRASNIRCITSITNDLPAKKTELKTETMRAASPDFNAKDFPSLAQKSNRRKNIPKQPPAPNANSCNHSNKKKPSTGTGTTGPPGFTASTLKTGFANTNMTFTSSLGQKFAVPPTAESSTSLKLKNANVKPEVEEEKDKKTNNYNNCGFILPPEFEQRNKILISTISAYCDGSADKFNKFKHLAATFRNGEIKGKEYYERCRQVMGKTVFLNVLPELLVLLPDISKQQAVLEAYKKFDGGRGSDACFAVCAICQQVLISLDFSHHMESHDEMQKQQFPTLLSANPYQRF